MIFYFANIDRILDEFKQGNAPLVYETSADPMDELFCCLSHWCFGTERYRTYLRVDVVMNIIELLMDDKRVAETPSSWYTTGLCTLEGKVRMASCSMVIVFDCLCFFFCRKSNCGRHY